MSIYKKLLNIQNQVKGLSKDKKSFGFDYVTGNKLLSFIKPIMDDEGLLLKQEILTIENVRQDYKTKNGFKEEILSKVMMRFTWIDSETGETDVNLFGANGQNGFDKGVGSALTYGERYFILKYFHIATDEDDIDNPNLEGSPEIIEEPKDITRLEKRLNACKDIKQLGEVWNSFTTEEKTATEVLKDLLKAKFMVKK